MRRWSREWLRRLTGLAFAALLAGACGSAAVAQTRDVTVFAAASLKNALDDVGAAWTEATGARAVVSYAASSALAKQIEQGAPADIFISADLDWMDYLAARKLIKDGSRVNLLGNSLVLIGPKGAAEVTVGTGFDLAGLLAGGRLALANVDAVPAGKYAKAALVKLGVWDTVRDRLAQTENVRAALLLVSRGEAPLGIVYRTDAAADPNVAILATVPADTHPPIVYPAALTASAVGDAAAGYLGFLASPEAKAIFEKQGFTPFQTR